MRPTAPLLSLLLLAVVLPAGGAGALVPASAPTRGWGGEPRLRANRVVANSILPSTLATDEQSQPNPRPGGPHMNPARFLSLLACMTVLVSAGTALSDEPVRSHGDSATLTPVQAAPVLPDLPENAAEIEALKNGITNAPVPTDTATPADADQPVGFESPQARELKALIASETAALAELQTRLDGAGADDAALAVQREIEQVKQQTEIDLLRLQARFAREAGQADRAAAIDAAIGELTAPRPVGVPQDRPAPDETRR